MRKGDPECTRYVEMVAREHKRTEKRQALHLKRLDSDSRARQVSTRAVRARQAAEKSVLGGDEFDVLWILHQESCRDWKRKRFHASCGSRAQDVDTEEAAVAVLDEHDFSRGCLAQDQRAGIRRLHKNSSL